MEQHQRAANIAGAAERNLKGGEDVSESKIGPRWFLYKGNRKAWTGQEVQCKWLSYSARQPWNQPCPGPAIRWELTKPFVCPIAPIQAPLGQCCWARPLHQPQPIPLVPGARCMLIGAFKAQRPTPIGPALLVGARRGGRPHAVGGAGRTTAASQLQEV